MAEKPFITQFNDSLGKIQQLVQESSKGGSRKSKKSRKIRKKR